MLGAKDENWRSPLTYDLLLKRSKLFTSLRKFFDAQNFLEVDVPLLGNRGVSDPHVHALETHLQGKQLFLQTSPEYFMKRLIAGGSGSIYYLGKAFRADAPSKKHNPEFTMCEWYFLGANDEQLMSQVEVLLLSLSPDLDIKRCSYESLFVDACGVNPHTAGLKELKSTLEKHVNISWEENDRSTVLDLIFTHAIEPNLQSPTLVFDYPECQCALAKVVANEKGFKVAKRFELFWKGLELANGYWELTDPKVQRARFEEDIQRRQALGYAVNPLDEAFLSAVESGLPECAGIALGVDRLFMCLENLESIRQAQSFSVNC